MTWAPSGARLGRVSDDHRIDGTHTLSLHVDSGADPIAGRLREGDGPAWDFVGWLGLARALELALEGGPAPGAEDAPAPATETPLPACSPEEVQP
jgi:hypothetical protein